VYTSWFLVGSARAATPPVLKYRHYFVSLFDFFSSPGKPSHSPSFPTRRTRRALSRRPRRILARWKRRWPRYIATTPLR